MTNQPKEVLLIPGQEITNLRTLNSQYGNGFIEAEWGTRIIRIPLSVIATILNEFEFTAEMKRVFLHLTEAMPLEQGEGWKK